MGLALDESKGNDKWHDIDGVGFLISDAVLPFTEEKKIDYIDSITGQGFVITPDFGSRC